MYYIIKNDKYFMILNWFNATLSSHSDKINLWYDILK